MLIVVCDKSSQTDAGSAAFKMSKNMLDMT